MSNKTGLLIVFFYAIFIFAEGPKMPRSLSIAVTASANAMG
jgi:hypothetical protein